MKQNENSEAPIEVPAANLSEQALLGIIESFILREGTDYGPTEISFKSKVQQIKEQMDANELIIAFDANSESVSLLKVSDFRRLEKKWEESCNEN